MNLVITKLPLRKGYWLALQDGTQTKALAKFRSPEAASEFMDYLERNNGKPLSFNRYVED
jgi:hypothetical protein